MRHSMWWPDPELLDVGDGRPRRARDAAGVGVTSIFRPFMHCRSHLVSAGNSLSRTSLRPAGQRCSSSPPALLSTSPGLVLSGARDDELIDLSIRQGHRGQIHPHSPGPDAVGADDHTAAKRFAAERKLGGRQLIT